MVAPVVSFYEDDDLTEMDSSNPLDFGTVDAATTSDEIEIHIWNNKGGVSEVSDMTNVRITTVTKNGLNSGDAGPEGNINAYGKETVEDTWIQVKSITNSETESTPIGGATTHTLDVIGGDISGNKHEITLKAAVPSDASSGSAELKTRVLYQYT